MNKIITLSVIVLALGLSGCDKKQQAATPVQTPAVTAQVAAPQVAEPMMNEQVQPIDQEAAPMNAETAVPSSKE